MKQRFSISRDTGGEKIVIKEYAELDKGVYSLLCEESYIAKAVEDALAEGADQVVTLLRTESFFPTRYFTEKLTTTLKDFIQQGGGETVRIEADDAECINTIPLVESEENSDGIDDLLDVDAEEAITDEQPVQKLEAPIKIAEDETSEISNSL